MSTLPVTIVAAMAENRVIGQDGEMPWHLPADMAKFRKLTMGKPVIMGRLTHESIGRVLDGRLNIVLSRQRGFRAPGFQPQDLVVANSLMEAIRIARDEAPSSAREIAIIGGASVYEQALTIASRLLLTEVHAHIAGDALFPKFNRDEWREVSRVEHVADSRNAWNLSFIELVRKGDQAASGALTTGWRT